MARLARIVKPGLALLAAAGAALWIAGPYEPVDLEAAFEPRKFGEGVGVYFESIESAYSDITPGAEKRVIWAGQRETRTPVSVVYIHGFSATSEEIRPVPDRVAAALGANLVYTRLSGHGRAGAAMAEPVAHDWMQDVAEALGTGRHVGRRVVVISNSTGGTLMTAAALDAELAKDIAGIVFLSPNYGLNHPAERLLTWPAARYWLPPLAGREIRTPVRSAAHETYWSTRFPSVAVLTLAALVKEVRGLDVAQARIPALFRFSDSDRVVRAERTHGIAARWGGPVAVQMVALGPEDDPNAHVIAGDVMSPGQTEATVAGILGWLEEIGIK